MQLKVADIPYFQNWKNYVDGYSRSYKTIVSGLETQNMARVTAGCVGMAILPLMVFVPLVKMEPK